MKTLYENGWRGDAIDLPLNYGDSITCKSITLVPNQSANEDGYPTADVYANLEQDGKSQRIHLTKRIDAVTFQNLMPNNPALLTDIKIEFAIDGVTIWSPDFNIGITVHESLEFKLLK